MPVRIGWNLLTYTYNSYGIDMIIKHERGFVKCFLIIPEISFSIFPEYQQKFHMITRGEATFVKNVPKCGRWHTYCIDKAVMAV